MARKHGVAVPHPGMPGVPAHRGRVPGPHGVHSEHPAASRARRWVVRVPPSTVRPLRAPAVPAPWRRLAPPTRLPALAEAGASTRSPALPLCMQGLRPPAPVPSLAFKPPWLPWPPGVLCPCAGICKIAPPPGMMESLTAPATVLHKQNKFRFTTRVQALRVPKWGCGKQHKPQFLKSGRYPPTLTSSSVPQEWEGPPRPHSLHSTHPPHAAPSRVEGALQGVRPSASGAPAARPGHSWWYDPQPAMHQGSKGAPFEEGFK